MNKKCRIVYNVFTINQIDLNSLLHGLHLRNFDLTIPSILDLSASDKRIHMKYIIKSVLGHLFPRPDQPFPAAYSHTSYPYVYYAGSVFGKI